MNRYFLIIIFTLINSSIAFGGCGEILSKFSKKLKPKNKRSIFLKSAPHKRSHLFFPKAIKAKKRSRFTNFVQFLPNKISNKLNNEKRDFTPFQGISEGIFDRPFRYMSNRLWNEELVPRLYITLPSTIAAGMYIFNEYIDPMTEQTYIDSIEQVIVNNSDKFDSLIEYDYRYFDIYKELYKNTITVEEARVKAYWNALAISEYLKFNVYLNRKIIGLNNFEINKFIKKNNDDIFINHILFSKIKSITSHGVPKNKKGFYIPPKANRKLTTNEIQTIFKIEHEKLLKAEMVSLFYRQKTDNKNSFIDKIPFYKKVKKLKIKKLESMALIQEYIYWEAKFKLWDILKIKKYKLDSNNLYTSKFLTIQDIEKSILNSY